MSDKAKQPSSPNSSPSRVETLPGISSDTIELLEGTRQRVLGDRAVRIQQNEEHLKTRNPVLTTTTATNQNQSSPVSSPIPKRSSQIRNNQQQSSFSNVNKNNKNSPILRERPPGEIKVDSSLTPTTTSAVDLSSQYASSRVPRMLSEMTNRTAIKHLMAQRDNWEVRRRRELYGGEDGRGVHMHVVDAARAAEREVDYQSELAALYTLLSGYVDAFRLKDRTQLRNYNSEEVLGKMDAVYETLKMEMAAVEEATGGGIENGEDGGERSGQSRQNDKRKKQQKKHLLEDISSSSTTAAAAAHDSENTSLLANNEELQRRIGKAIVKSGTSKQDDYAMLQEGDISKFYLDREVKVKTASHQLANAGFAVPLSTSTQSNYHLLQQALGGGEGRPHHHPTNNNTGLDDNADDEEDVAVLGMTERIVNNLRYNQASNARAMQEEDEARVEMGLPPLVRNRVQPTTTTTTITSPTQSTNNNPPGGGKAAPVSFDDFEVDTGLQERLWRATGMLSATIRDDDNNDNDASGDDNNQLHSQHHHLSSIGVVDEEDASMVIMPTAPSKESEVLREQSHQNIQATHEIAKEVIRLNTKYNGVLHADTDLLPNENNQNIKGGDDDVADDGTVVKALFVEDDFKGRRPFRAFCEPFGIVESSPAAAALLCPPEFIREDEVKRHALARIQKTLRAAEEKRRVEANENDMNKKRLARITGGSVDYLSSGGGGGRVKGLQARVPPPPPSHDKNADLTASGSGDVPRTRDACIETVSSIADLLPPHHGASSTASAAPTSEAGSGSGGSTFTIQSNFSKQYARDLANLFNKLATNNVVHVAVEEDPYFSTVAFPCVRNTVTPLGPLNGELLRQYYDYGLSPIAPKTIKLPTSSSANNNNDNNENTPNSVVSCSTRFSSRRWEIQRNLLECILHGGFDVRYVTSLLTELQDYAQDNAHLKAKLVHREKQLAQSRKYYNGLLQKLRSKEEVRVSRWAGNIADATSLAALLEYDDIATNTTPNPNSSKGVKKGKASSSSSKAAATKSKSFEELRRYMGFTGSGDNDNGMDDTAPSETSSSSVVDELMKALSVIRQLKKSSSTTTTINIQTTSTSTSSSQQQPPPSDATSPNPMFELQRVLANSDALRKSLMISSGYFTPTQSSLSSSSSPSSGGGGSGSTVIQSLVDISRQEVQRCRRAMMEHCRLREEMAMSQEDSMAHLFHMHVSTHHHHHTTSSPTRGGGGVDIGSGDNEDYLQSNLISPQSSMPRQSRRGSKKGVMIPVGAHIGVVSRMASSTLGSVLQSVNGGSPRRGDQSPPYYYQQQQDNSKSNRGGGGGNSKKGEDPKATRAEDEAKLFPNLAVGGYGGMFQLGDNVFIKIRELFRALTSEQQAVLRHGRPLVPHQSNIGSSNSGGGLPPPTPMPIMDSAHGFLLKERAQLVQGARGVDNSHHGGSVGAGMSSYSPPSGISPRDAELAAVGGEFTPTGNHNNNYDDSNNRLALSVDMPSFSQYSRPGTMMTAITNNRGTVAAAAKSAKRNLYNDPIRFFDSEGEAGFVTYILPRLSSQHASALKNALSQRKDNQNNSSVVDGGGDGGGAPSGLCSKCSAEIQPPVSSSSLSANGLLPPSPPQLGITTPLLPMPTITTTNSSGNKGIQPTSSTLKASPIHETPLAPHQALPTTIMPSDDDDDGFNGSATMTPVPLAALDISSVPGTPRPPTNGMHSPMVMGVVHDEGALYAAQHGGAAMAAEVAEAKAEIKRLANALEAETATSESLKVRVKHLADQEASSGDSYRALVSEIEEMKYDWEEKEDDLQDQIDELKNTSESQAAELLTKQQAYLDLQGKYEELTHDLQDLKDDRNAVLRSTGVIEWLKITGGGGMTTGADHRASVVAASNRFRNLSNASSPSMSTNLHHHDKRTSPQNHSLAPPPGALKAGIDKFDVFSLGLHRGSVTGVMSSSSHLPDGEGTAPDTTNTTPPTATSLLEDNNSDSAAMSSSKLATAAAASMVGVVDTWFPFEGGFGSEMWRDYIIPPATLPDVPSDTTTTTASTKSIHSILKLAHTQTHQAKSNGAGAAGGGVGGRNPQKSPSSPSTGLNDDTTASPKSTVGAATVKTSPRATKGAPKKKGLGGKSTSPSSPLQRRSSSRVALLVPPSASSSSPDLRQRRRSSSFPQVATEAVSAAAAVAPQLLLVTPIGGSLGTGAVSNTTDPSSVPTTTTQQQHTTDVILLGDNHQYKGANAVVSSSMWWGSGSASFYNNIEPASSSLFSGEEDSGTADGNSSSQQHPASPPSAVAGLENEYSPDNNSNINKVTTTLPRAVIVPVAVQIPESVFHTHFDPNPINSRTIPPTGAARLSTTSTSDTGGTMSTNIHFNSYKNIAYIYYRKYHELRTRIAKKLEVELRRLEEEVSAINNNSAKHPGGGVGSIIGGGNTSPSSLSSFLPHNHNTRTRPLFESSNHDTHNQDDAYFTGDGGLRTRSDVSSSSTPQLPPPRTFTDPTFLSVKMVDKCVGGGELPYNPFFLTPLMKALTSSPTTSPSGTVTMVRMKPPHEGTQTDLVQSRTVPKILPAPEKKNKKIGEEDGGGVSTMEDTVAAQRYWIQQMLTSRTSRGGQAALQSLLSVLEHSSPTPMVSSSMVGGPLSESLVANMPSVAPWSTLLSSNTVGAVSSSIMATSTAAGGGGGGGVGMSAASRISTTRPFYSKYLAAIDQESSTAEHHTQVYPSGLLTIETNENVPTQTSRLPTPEGPETHGIHCQTDGELMRGYYVGGDGDDEEVGNFEALSESGAPPALNPFPSIGHNQPQQPIRLNNRSGNVVDTDYGGDVVMGQKRTSATTSPLRPLSVSAHNASSVLLPQMPSTNGLDGLDVVTTDNNGNEGGRGTHYYPPDAAVPSDTTAAFIPPPPSRGGLPPMSRSGARVLSPSIRQLTSAAATDQRVGSRRGIGSRQGMVRTGSSPVGDGILQSRDREGRGTPISNADSTIFNNHQQNINDHNALGNPSDSAAVSSSVMHPPKQPPLHQPTPFVSLLESGNVDNYEAIPLESPTTHHDIGDEDDGDGLDAHPLANTSKIRRRETDTDNNHNTTTTRPSGGYYASSSMRCTPSTTEQREEYRRITLASAGGAGNNNNTTATITKNLATNTTDAGMMSSTTNANITSTTTTSTHRQQQPSNPFLIKTAATTNQSKSSTTTTTTTSTTPGQPHRSVGGAAVSFGGSVTNKDGPTRGGRLVAIHGVGGGVNHSDHSHHHQGGGGFSGMGIMGGLSSSSSMMISGVGGGGGSTSPRNATSKKLHQNQSSSSSLFPISTTTDGGVTTNRQHAPHDTTMDTNTFSSSSPALPTEYDRLTKAASAAMLRGGGGKRRSGVGSFRVPSHNHRGGGATTGSNNTTNHHRQIGMVAAAARIAQQLGVRAVGMRGGGRSLSSSPIGKRGGIAGAGVGGGGDATNGAVGVVPLARQGSLEPLRYKAPSPTEEDPTANDDNLMRVSSVVPYHHSQGHASSGRSSPSHHHHNNSHRTPSPSLGGVGMLSLSHSTSFPIQQMQPPLALSSKPTGIHNNNNTAGMILSPISSDSGAAATLRGALSAPKRVGGARGGGGVGGGGGEVGPDFTLFNVPRQGSGGGGNGLYQFGLGPGEESSSLFVRSTSPIHHHDDGGGGGVSGVVTSPPVSSGSPPKRFNVFPHTRALLAPVGKSFGSRKKPLDAAKARQQQQQDSSSSPPPE